MKQLKAYLNLYTDLKQPYFYGLIFVISMLSGTFLHIDWMIYPIVVSFIAGILVTARAFIVDSMEKIRGGWDITVFIFMILGVIAMVLLSKLM